MTAAMTTATTATHMQTHPHDDCDDAYGFGARLDALLSARAPQVAARATADQGVAAREDRVEEVDDFTLRGEDVLRELADSLEWRAEALGLVGPVEVSRARGAADDTDPDAASGVVSLALRLPPGDGAAGPRHRAWHLHARIGRDEDGRDRDQVWVEVQRDDERGRWPEAEASLGDHGVTTSPQAIAQAFMDWFSTLL